MARSLPDAALALDRALYDAGLLQLANDAAALTMGTVNNGNIVPLVTLDTTASPKMTLAGDLTATGE